MWLEDCFAQWKYLPPGVPKYNTFPAGIDFAAQLGERGIGRTAVDAVRIKEDLERLEGEAGPGPVEELVEAGQGVEVEQEAETEPKTKAKPRPKAKTKSKAIAKSLPDVRADEDTSVYVEEEMAAGPSGSRTASPDADTAPAAPKKKLVRRAGSRRDPGSLMEVEGMLSGQAEAAVGSVDGATPAAKQPLPSGSGSKAAPKKTDKGKGKGKQSADAQEPTPDPDADADEDAAAPSKPAPRKRAPSRTAPKRNINGSKDVRSDDGNGDGDGDESSTLELVEPTSSRPPSPSKPSASSKPSKPSKKPTPRHRKDSDRENDAEHAGVSVSPKSTRRAEVAQDPLSSSRTPVRNDSIRITASESRPSPSKRSKRISHTSKAKAKSKAPAADATTDDDEEPLSGAPPSPVPVAKKRPAATAASKKVHAPALDTHPGDASMNMYASTSFSSSQVDGGRLRRGAAVRAENKLKTDMEDLTDFQSQMKRGRVVGAWEKNGKEVAPVKEKGGKKKRSSPDDGDDASEAEEQEQEEPHPKKRKTAAAAPAAKGKRRGATAAPKGDEDEMEVDESASQEPSATT
jgi:hypothetical protein